MMEEETTLAAPSVDSEVSGSLGLGKTCSSTGTETTLPPNTARRPRWLYKVKHAAIGSIDKYKAWFIVRGFYKREGVDYEDTFAPVARYTSIRTIMSLASVFG